MTDKKPARETGPDYYRNQPIQPWDVIDADAPPEERIGYYRWTAIAYLMRMGEKPDNPRTQEVKKAKHYLEKLLEVLEGIEMAPAIIPDFTDWAKEDAARRWEEALTETREANCTATKGNTNEETHTCTCHNCNMYAQPPGYGSDYHECERGKD